MSTRAQSGFTITEALIAAAVFSSVVLATAPFLQTALKSSASVNRRFAHIEMFRTSQQAIRSTLAAHVYLGAEHSAYGFSGDHRRFEFTALDHHGQTTRRVAFDISYAEKELALSAQSAPLINAADKQTATLIAPLYSARMEYYGAPTKDAPRDWRNNWEGPQPPELVAITGVLLGADKSNPFRIETAIASSAPMTCRFDAVSRTCRGEK